MNVLQHIKCQFGNILFQLSAGSYFAKQHSLEYFYISYPGHEIYLDKDYNYILDKFNIYDYNKMNIHTDADIIKYERNNLYEPLQFIENKNFELFGYFQNWKYINYEYSLELFCPSITILNKINNILSINEIKKSICIHLRFHTYEFLYQDFCDNFNRLETIIQKNYNKQILIFTDDLSKVLKFKKYSNVIIFSEKSNSFILDFYALTLGQYLIGGASTFFIWAVYLNTNNNMEISFIKESQQHFDNKFIQRNVKDFIYNKKFNPTIFKSVL